MSCLDLRERFPGYRMGQDKSHIPGQRCDPWLLEILCKYGKIYPYGGEELCAYTDHPRFMARLRALPGAVVHQEGDQELVVRFPAEAWPSYFRLLGARRKRTASPAVMAALQKALEQRRRGASRGAGARRDVGATPESSECIWEAP